MTAASLNIRNFPTDLLERVKLKALLEKRPMREAVIEVLEQYAASVNHLAADRSAHPGDNAQKAQKLRRKLERKE